MNTTKDDHSSLPQLRYKKGDLIIKEGDYGLSIYKVIQGKVQIFTESDSVEIPLATLTAGEVIGEMILLDRDISQRAASVRALEDSILEVWHPSMLSNEYKEMPSMLKYIADQALNRLVRMNKVIAKLTRKQQQNAMLKRKDPWSPQRRFYRKQVDLPFVAEGIDSNQKDRFTGSIKDISLSGAGLEIGSKKLAFPLQLDEIIVINTTLPNKKEISVTAQIISINQGKSPGTLLLGVSFTELSPRASKDLGFFLLPA
ncbi:MAG: cyclic nucleotide-binding domain-containing protein [Deltaproteobacteria bacterium]|nr:cyclic nucleotide-binding domain-containing protein [Deltaproteobacteria bacterium]